MEGIKIWSELILSIIGIIFLIITIVWGIVHNKTAKPIDLPMNYDIVLNFPRSKLTGGHYLGGLKKKREGRNGTTLIEFYPLDIEQGELAPKPIIYKLRIKNENMRWIKGRERTLLMITSKDKIDYPKEMRDSLETKYMSTEGLKSYVVDVWGEGFKEMYRTLTQLMIEYGGGEITSHTLNKLKEDREKIADFLNFMEEKKKSEENK